MFKKIIEKIKSIDKVLLSFIISVIFGIFNGVLSILEGSLWFLILAIYFVSLAIVRGGIVSYQSKHNYNMKESVQAYKKSGILLLVMGLTLAFAVYEVVAVNEGFKYPGILIYGVGAYTAFKVIGAIIYFCKHTGNKDFSKRAVMHINLTDAFVSILALQTALLNEFATGATPTIVFNIITGVGVCLYSLIAGVYMIVKANNTLRNLDGSEKTEDTQVIEAIKEREIRK
jgi:hypothetical protein